MKIRNNTSENLNLANPSIDLEENEMRDLVESDKLNIGKIIFHLENSNISLLDDLDNEITGFETVSYQVRKDTIELNQFANS